MKKKEIKGLIGKSSTDKEENLQDMKINDTSESNVLDKINRYFINTANYEENSGTSKDLLSLKIQRLMVQMKFQ